MQNNNWPKALVVDDSTTVQRLMGLALQPLQIEVDIAGTGEDAQRLLQQNTYDIVFLDVMLPGIDGYQVCKSIKNNKATKSTPVIMLTSRDSAFDKVRGIMAGTDLYLTKPLESSQITAAARKYIRSPVGRVQFAG